MLLHPPGSDAPPAHMCARTTHTLTYTQYYVYMQVDAIKEMLQRLLEDDDDMKSMSFSAKVKTQFIL